MMRDSGSILMVLLIDRSMTGCGMTVHARAAVLGAASCLVAEDQPQIIPVPCFWALRKPVCQIVLARISTRFPLRVTAFWFIMQTLVLSPPHKQAGSPEAVMLCHNVPMLLTVPVDTPWMHACC